MFPVPEAPKTPQKTKLSTDSSSMEIKELLKSLKNFLIHYSVQNKKLYSYILHTAYGIKFVLTEESYTSKADFLAKDYIPVYKNSSGNHFFSGKRIQRGLYRHYDGTITNADINGAANILRKVFPKVSQWDRGIVDMPCSAGCVEHSAGSCRSAA